MTEFETHLTVDDDGRLDALSRWADEHGLAFLHIVLDRGRAPSQPMLTRRGRGAYEEELGVAKELQRELHAAGFSVTRIKIEAPAESDLAGQYFEHHVKLVLPAGADLASLRDIANRHGGHLSRNARRMREDGLLERFITQRCSVEARCELQQLLSALGTGLVARVETELVVHDSNLEADAGWMTP